MEYYIKITIYGSNTDIKLNGRSVKTPSLATVQALMDLESYELETVAINAEPNIESTTIKKWDFYTFIRNRVFWSAKPTGIEKNYEAENKSFEAFYGTKAISKKYLWVHIPDYILMPEGMTNDKVLAINVSGGSFTHNPNNGTKAVTYNLLER